RGDLFPLGSFGHTGFTGTSLWIDPHSNGYLIFLSNRVHPDGKGDVTPLRGAVATVAAASLIDSGDLDTLLASGVRFGAARRASPGTTYRGGAGAQRHRRPRRGEVYAAARQARCPADESGGCDALRRTDHRRAERRPRREARRAVQSRAWPARPGRRKGGGC